MGSDRDDAADRRDDAADPADERSDRRDAADERRDGGAERRVAGPAPRFSPRVKSAVLWGLVGALAFLVLVQGYALLVEPLVTIVQGGAIALLVGIGAAIGAYLLEHRIARWAADRAEG